MTRSYQLLLLRPCVLSREDMVVFEDVHSHRCCTRLPRPKNTNLVRRTPTNAIQPCWSI